MRCITFLAVVVILLAFTTVCVSEDRSEAVDARLDQKVTYQAKGAVIHKVLDELTEKTGVVMTCGDNKDDWQMRDRKVNVFVKDMPLKDLQKTLADILHFTWARGRKDDAYTYRLFQDRRSRKQEEDLRTKEAEEKAKKQFEKRQAALADLEKLDSLTPDEIAKLKEESPLLYVMAREPFGKAMSRMLRNMPPDALAAFAEGRDVKMDLWNKSPQIVEAAREFVTGVDSLIQRLSSDAGSHAGLAEFIYDARLKISQPTANLGDESHGGILGMLEIEASGHDDIQFPLFDANSPVAKVLGRALTRLIDDGASRREIVEREMQESMSRIALETPEVESLPDDPDLKKKPKLELKGRNTLGDVLEEIAKKTDLQIVSDHFVHRPQQLPIKDNTLGEILKITCATYGKEAKKKGTLLTIEDRRWFEKRSWEVREDWLEYWRKAASDGKLGFEDVVDIGCLTDSQITNTIMADKDLQPVSWSVLRNRHILRFYAVLSEQQKQMLRSEGGLDAAALTPEQWPYLEAVASTKDDQTSGSRRMTVYLKKYGGMKLHEFKLTVTPEAEGRPSTTLSWMIDIPTPPPKPAGVSEEGPPPPPEPNAQKPDPKNEKVPEPAEPPSPED